MKARKGARINRLPMAPPEPQSLEGCAAGAVTTKDKMVSMAPATNMAPERPASDQANHVEARARPLAPSRSRSFVPSATTGTLQHHRYPIVTTNVTMRSAEKNREDPVCPPRLELALRTAPLD